MPSDRPFDGDNPDQSPKRNSPDHPQQEPRTHARRNSSAVPMESAPPAPRRAPQVPRAARNKNGGPPPSFPPARPPAQPEGVPATRVMPAAQRPAQAQARQMQPGQQQRTQQQAQQRPPQAPPAAPLTRKHKRRKPLVVLAFILVLLIAWPIGLVMWGNGKIEHIEALSDAPDTPARTFLLAGSDSRDDGYFDSDPTEGNRTDTVMLLTIPKSGNSSLISLPRDAYVEIPGHNPNKINAAYALGGPSLLVETVEALSGQKVDHYVEIGMGGVAEIVDAVGGVELCLDYDVSDRDSQLEWQAGCHMADGAKALAFARMRKSDPLGDIGRTQRQQQVINAVTSSAISPSLLNPFEQVRLANAGFSAFATDDDTGVVDLARLAWAFRGLRGDDAVRGAPPIADLNYRPGGVGSAVRLADNAPEFFAAVADGSVTKEMLD